VQILQWNKTNNFVFCESIERWPYLFYYAFKCSRMVFVLHRALWRFQRRGILHNHWLTYLIKPMLLISHCSVYVFRTIIFSHIIYDWNDVSLVKILERYFALRITNSEYKTHLQQWWQIINLIATNNRTF